MASLSIQLFGSLQIRLDGKPLQAFGTEKMRALFVYLLLEAQQAHTRTFLSGMLWPDQSERLAQHNFRQALSTLRKILAVDQNGQPFIISVSDSIQFNRASDYETDIDLFFRLLEKGFPPKGRINAASLRAALDLYQAALLDQFDLSDSNIFSEWLFLRREDCNRRAIQALVQLVDFHKRRIELDLAYRYAEKLAQLAPWDESAHLEAIRLLAQNGEYSLAVARFESMRHQLEDLLDMEPSHTAERLLKQIRQAAEEENPLQAERPAPTHNIRLGELHFHGREQELESLQACISDRRTRLVTILGVGGVGKSRLALQAAHSQIGVFAAGVWYINLADGTFLENLHQVLQIYPSSRFSPLERAIQFLSAKEILLVLDSFEHVQSEAGQLASLMAAAPGVVALVTSRQRLNLQIEQVFPLDGLEIPPDSIDSSNQAQKYSASALFVDHVRRVHPRKTLLPEDFKAIADICRILNGLPLGLELAAAATWGSSLESIAQQLRQNLDFINTRCEDVAPRHRSLRAAFYYSWDRLNESQRAVLVCLAVYQGSFQGSHAAEVTGQPMAILLELLDRSLLRQTSDSRLEIPEPIFPYVQEILCQNAGQVEQLSDKHAEFYCTLFVQQAALIAGPDMTYALKILVPELANGVQAWQWFIVKSDQSLLQRLVDPLHSLLQVRSEFFRSIALLEPAAGLAEEKGLSSRLLAALLLRLGSDYLRLGWTTRAEKTLRRGLDLLPSGGSPVELAMGLDALAMCCHKQARQEEARQLAQQCLAISRANNEMHGQKNALYLLAEIEFRLGNLNAARALMEDSLRIARRSGNPLAVLQPLSSLGDYACYQEEYRSALNNFEECLGIATQAGNHFHRAIQHNNIGTVQHMLGNYGDADENYRDSLQLCRRIGYLEGEAVALGNLGEIMVIQSQYSAAIDYFERSLSIARQIENPRTIAVALNNLGEIYRVLGQLERAGQYFIAGLQGAWEKKVISQVLESLTGLGILLINGEQKWLGQSCLSLVCAHASTEPDDRMRAQKHLVQIGEREGGLPRLEEIVAAVMQACEFANSLAIHPEQPAVRPQSDGD